MQLRSDERPVARPARNLERRRSAPYRAVMIRQLEVAIALRDRDLADLAGDPDIGWELHSHRVLDPVVELRHRQCPVGRGAEIRLDLHGIDRSDGRDRWGDRDLCASRGGRGEGYGPGRLELGVGIVVDAREVELHRFGRLGRRHGLEDTPRLFQCRVPDRRCHFACDHEGRRRCGRHRQVIARFLLNCEAHSQPTLSFIRLSHR